MGLPQLRLDRGVPGTTSKEVSGAELASLEASYAKLKPGPGKSPADVLRNQRVRIQSATAEILADQGYDAVTVRTLARRAGVSTRTFYQCYAGKEECVLELHEQAARRLLAAMAASQGSVESFEERQRQAVEALWRELSCDAGVARLLLVEIHIAGREGQAQARRVRRSIEAVMTGCLDPLVADTPTFQLIVRGVVSGLLGMARSCLWNEQYPALPDLSKALASWALACFDPSLLGFEAPGLRSPSSAATGVERDGKVTTNTDVALLLAAVIKLGAAGDPRELSTRDVLTAAGLPRRVFDAHFDSLEDCIVAALEVTADEKMAEAVQAAQGQSVPAERVVRAIAFFCEDISQDSVLSSFLFGPLAMSGIPKMRCQESIEARVARLIAQPSELPTGVDSSLVSKASAAACWGLLEDQVASRGSTRATGLCPILGYLILAPAVGPSKAVTVIRTEYNFRNTTREECLNNHG